MGRKDGDYSGTARPQPEPVRLLASPLSTALPRWLTSIYAWSNWRTRAGTACSAMQSNAEYELVERVQASRQEGVDFILINPAAFTHTSIALRDSLMAVGIPFIEIHLSNTHARETFRHHSYFSDIAQGVICGLGAQGYELGLQAALTQLERS